VRVDPAASHGEIGLSFGAKPLYRTDDATGRSRGWADRGVHLANAGLVDCHRNSKYALANTVDAANATYTVVQRSGSRRISMDSFVDIHGRPVHRVDLAVGETKIVGLKKFSLQPMVEVGVIAGNSNIAFGEVPKGAVTDNPSLLGYRNQ